MYGHFALYVLQCINAFHDIMHLGDFILIFFY